MRWSGLFDNAIASGGNSWTAFDGDLLGWTGDF